ncbi:MAG: sigma-70 family RNA polymerase sigma factor [Pseudomonadota bacterium]
MTSSVANSASNSEPLSGSELANVPDEALVAGYLAGDQTAFEVLYTRHKGAIFRYLLHQLPRAAAEDAFQETWLKIVKALPGYSEQGKFQAYIFRICHNVLMDHHRASMKGVEETGIDEDLEDTGSEVSGNASNMQLREILMRQLAALPVAQRSAWILKHETQLTINQIAELTDTTAEGVKSRLRYAMDKLKSRMQKYV